MKPDAKKILIVDDEPDVAELLKLFVEGLGYVGLTAGNAAAALSLVELEKPDLVLLDVVMPGTDGLECLKMIKAGHPEAVVIVVSGLQDEGIAKEAIRNGAYDYVTKPFDLQFIQQNILSRLFD